MEIDIYLLEIGSIKRSLPKQIKERFLTEFVDEIMCTSTITGGKRK